MLELPNSNSKCDNNKLAKGEVNDVSSSFIQPTKERQNNMKYKQLTSDERYTIAAFRKVRLSVYQMAKEMNRHPSTIYREINRNIRKDGGYRGSKAISRTKARRARSRRNPHYTLENFDLVRILLRKKWSPEQISGVLKYYGLFYISHETIYKYVWWDKATGGTLYKYLRQASKKRRKRYRAYNSRGVLAGKRHISERPEVIDKRERIGDWEIDTVMGSGDKHCIVTLVERKTGYTLIGKLRNKTKEELNWVTRKMIRAHEEKVLTITADNGTEFHGYSDLEHDTGVTFYFATPYHSWERGTNENTNGLIRQYLPKRKSMANLTQRICNKIAYELNTRPRKRHGFISPWTMFWED